MTKTMQNIQQEVDDWIKSFGGSYWQPLSIIARLAEETGELARVVNDRFGEKQKRTDENEQDMKTEIGDIIYTLCCLTNSQKIDLEECFKLTMAKYQSRDKDRFSKK